MTWNSYNSTTVTVSVIEAVLRYVTTIINLQVKMHLSTCVHTSVSGFGPVSNAVFKTLYMRTRLQCGLSVIKVTNQDTDSVLSID